MLPTIRLFCFPFAGGGASIYRHWPALFDKEALVGTKRVNVDVVSIQLPGREDRIRDRLLKSAGAMARHVVPTIAPMLDGPFALFGHSMGALLAYEVAQHLRSGGHPQPSILIVSARRPPQMVFRSNPRWNLQDEAFRQRLRELDGTPAAVLDDSELMELLGPMLRADFQIDEAYSHPAWYAPLNCPIVAFGANNDKELPISDLLAWANVTTGGVTLKHVFDDNHFFVMSRAPELVSDIASLLRDVVRP